MIHFDGSVVRFDDGSEDRDIQSRDAFPEPDPARPSVDPPPANVTIDCAPVVKATARVAAADKAA
jgi:hypothetical protein